MEPLKGPPTRKSLAKFWNNLFPLVANTVLYRLGTCNGMFRLEQREFGRVRVGTEIPCRNDLFFTTRDALAVLQVPEWKTLSTLHFGAIFPTHHPVPTGIWLLPLPPGVEPLDVQHDMQRPRDFDRHNVFKVGTGSSAAPLACPMGEFVIDVDLESQLTSGKYNNENKYDRTGICPCAHDKCVCNTCWALFLDPARHILLKLLREMLGFKAMFCVYSGRRGFHLWVIDKRAVMATMTQRRAWIAALKVAWHHQPWIYDMLGAIFDAHPVLSARPRRCGVDSHREAVMEALYPKLDEKVSVDATHLHKSVMVPHHVTGNMCMVMFGPRFVPSEDVVHVDEVTEVDMRHSERLILLELDKAV